MMRFEEFLGHGSTRLDAHQMAAVMCDDNCVVSAGAGSGKTTVLSYRFLRLVLEGKAKADEILTLTFTRKAAREMQKRIHGQLLSCSDDPAIAAQVADFGSTSISTLDSFCSSIVTLDSLHYGIVSDYSIDDEASKKSVRRAAKALLDRWPQSEGARILSTLYTPDRLIDEVLLPLATQHYHLPAEVDAGAAPIILSEVERAYARLMGDLVVILGRYASLSDPTATVVAVASEAQELLDSLAACSSYHEELTLLASPFGHRRKPSGKKGDLLILNESWPTYLEVRTNVCVALSVLTNPERLSAVIDFTARFIEAVHTEKRESGILTFADVSSLAVDILKRNKALRRRFKERYRYIMIDEFQDNNELQKDLLYLLSERLDREGDGIPAPCDLERDKLFFVGDEKQSIYRFRGADVSVFKALGDELGSSGGKSFHLATNYRSEPALIEWFNTIFPSIMAHSGERWEADFEELGTRGATEGIKASVTALIKPYTESDSEEEELAKASDSEAYAVAALVEEMLTTDHFLIPSDEGPRRPKSGEIALLMRTTANQLSFEKALRQRRIPYSVQAARSLMLESVAGDLYAMLQLILYPEDRLAYAVVLRSPFCNLSDRALVSVMEHPPFTPIPDLSADDQARYAECALFYEELRLLVGTAPLTVLIHALFYESGYYLHLVKSEEYQVYVEHYTFLHRLAQIHQSEGKSVSQFVDFLREHLAQNEKIEDLEVIKEVEEGVQLMSIHKSKGLEFPIVIVANTGSKAKRTEALISTYANVPIPHYLDEPISESPTKVMRARHAGQLEGQDEELLRERAELKRLLYVALTRSETHLVFSGSFTRNNRSLTKDGHADTLLLMLTEALGLDISNPALERGIVRVLPIEPIKEGMLYGSRREGEEAFALRLAEKRRWYEGSREAIEVQVNRVGVTTLYPARMGEGALPLPLLESDEILARYGEEQVTAFGTLVHFLLEERIMGGGEGRIPIPPALVGHLSASELATLQRDGRSLVDSFFESELYLQEIAPYPRHVEVGFFLKRETAGRPVAVEGAIDLVVDQGTGVLVVDFKSDRWWDERAHEGQLRTYMEAAAKIWEKPVTAAVVFVRDCSRIVYYR